MRLALQRIRQSQLRGLKRVIVNYWWLHSLWKSGGRWHQMCRRGRVAKGLSLPSQKQCSNLAVMHFCVIDCLDAAPPILFLRGHWCPPLSSLDEENLVGFQLRPARTFRRFFWWQEKPLETSGASFASIYVSASLHFISDSWREMRKQEKQRMKGIQCVEVNVCVLQGVYVWRVELYSLSWTSMDGGSQWPTNHMRGLLIYIINCWQ